MLDLTRLIMSKIYNINKKFFRKTINKTTKIINRTSFKNA